MSRRWIEIARWVIPIAAGLAAGAVSSAWFAVPAAPDTTQERMFVESTYSDNPTAVREPRRDGGAPTTASVGFGERVEASRLEPSSDEIAAIRASQRALGQDMHRVAVEEHAAEPLDRVWAYAMRSRLEERAQAAASEVGATLVEVECRSITCASTFEWPDYETAHANAMQLMAADLGTHCGRRLSLLDERMEDRPFHATLLIDCSDAADRGRDVLE